ncbi:MAG TPA: carboxymuconolactone decarboxylase family protein [Burkholderiales bacterium]|nr:carboxymuconolactone decarboxylase family protein [Burkholderiales bacterium]
MARLQPPAKEAMSAEQRAVHDAIAAGPRGAVYGPLAVWLHRPGLAGKAQELGRYCRYHSSLPPILSELAILVTARHWISPFEWHAHKAIALKAGLDPAIVEAIRTRQQPAFGDDKQAVVYAFARTLHAERKVPDDLYARAVAALGEGGVVDLVGILGYYTLISMTINVFEVDLPKGAVCELE